MDFDAFEKLVKARRAVRKFTDAPLEDGVLERLLDAARWAPSGYNLQPTHFVAVTDPKIKARLRVACLGQRQIEQAPATVVFAGDRRVLSNNFLKMMQHEEEAGALHPGYKASLEKFVPLAFDTGPAGIGWLWKATLPRLRRVAMPTPELPAIHRRFWLAKQVSLSAMVFMLAATAAGLGTCPMEGFDEPRVRKILGIPAYMVLVVIIPVGHSADGPLKRSRIPLGHIVHHEHW